MTTPTIKAQAIVLAAGKATRFNTGDTKLLEQLCGQALVLYPTTLFERMGVATTVVVGYQKQAVMAAITARHGDTVTFVEQTEQKGTGHALMCTRDLWQQDHVFIMNGDVPLVAQSTLEKLYEQHITTDAAMSFITAHNSDDTHSYGRVIQTDARVSIVEARDFTGDTDEQCCINAGIYLVKKQFLQEHVDAIAQSKTSSEFYITDLVRIASDKKYHVELVTAPFDQVRGVNTFQEMWAAQQIKRSSLIKHWMAHGVHFAKAQTVHVDLHVSIGPGTKIGSGVHLFGNTAVGARCTIEPFTIVRNGVIEDNATVYSHTVITNAHIAEGVCVGPFAHIQEQSVIGAHSTIGNFVEIKRSTLGSETKVKHLSYLGDAALGRGVNIGAGTITCNHDGVHKQKTTIANNAYIGSNNTLVAPVTVNAHAFTAAGSVITDDVPTNALAIARSRQVNKLQYAKKLRANSSPESAHKTASFVGAVKTSVDISSSED